MQSGEPSYRAPVPHPLGVETALQMLREGETSAERLVVAALARAERAQQEWNPFSCLLSDVAPRIARSSDQRRAQGKAGVLEGLPIAIKDMIDTAGVETCYGSRAFQGNVPVQHAKVVEQLLHAGAVLIGKTRTHEFAWGVTTASSFYGDTLNPIAGGCIPGGSSGGAAAAVAAGVVAVGLGTDTGGSVRIPAALCGVVGFKPTQGAWSSKGIFPLSATLDHPGLIGSSVNDVAALASVLGVPGTYLPQADPARVLVLEALADVPVSPVIAARFAKAIDRLESSALAVRMGLGDSMIFNGCFDAFSAIVLGEGAREHFSRHSATAIAELYEPDTQERLEVAKRQTMKVYGRAQDERRDFVVKLDRMMQGVDFLILPTCPCPPPAIGDHEVRIGSWTGSIRAALMTYTAPFNLSGLPAISVPLPRMEGKVPVGMQIVAKRGEDARLLAFAQRLEMVLWS